MDDTQKISKVIYVLYLIGVIFPVTTLVGIVFAYIYRDDAQDYLISHFRYQIQGFWLCLFYTVVSWLLCFILIGWVLVPLTALWWIIRNAIGLKQISKQQPVFNPNTWLF